MNEFKRMFHFMRPYLFLFCVGIFLYNVQGFALSFALGVMGRNAMAGILTGEVQEVVRGILIAMGLFLVCIAFVGFGIIVGVRALILAERDLKKALFSSFVRCGFEVSQTGHSGEGIAAINTDANTARELYFNALSNLLRPIITATFSVTTLFIVDWRIGLAALGLGTLAYLIQSRYVKPLADIGKKQLEANAEAVKNITDLLAAAMPIRAFNQQDKMLTTAGAKMHVLRLLDFRRAFISMWQRLFTTVQGWLALAIVFGLGGWLVATGAMDFPMLMLILPLLEGITESMGGIGTALAGMQPPIEAAKRVLAIIDKAPPPACANAATATFNGTDIHIDNLTFTYADAPAPALHNISLDIKQGQMVAFIGPSGSGKSTLLRAITGFYERPRLGISLGGASIDEVSKPAWRTHFAYVDQSCKLFDMTIRENIALGFSGEATQEQMQEQIENAARRAHIHDFIESLEEKYDTPCGEKGASLSGGQKQRIAIARALMKGAPILVFDEATAALDPENEQAIMATIESLRRGHTILITTHNPDNITNADQIISLENGKLV